ncbi:MAG: DUF1501 domain-containing protein [Isosphaeraceae bacterium]
MSGSGQRRVGPVGVLSRRELLRVGGLGLGLRGLGLSELLQGRAAAGQAPGTLGGTFGKARACILLFMWGGPAQQETWDLKPEAPEGVRGEFRPIETNVPGIWISEHFPRLAQQAHRLAVIRSVHHADVNHTTATHELLTGRPAPQGVAAPLGEDFPHLGAVLAHLNKGRERSALPPFVQMRPEVPDGAPRFVEQSHGQSAGWLGPSLNPLTIDEDPNRPEYQARHASAFRLPDGLGPDRLDDRRRLLRLVERQARSMETLATASAFDVHHARAHALLTDRSAMEAFDLDREDPRVRDRYGRHPHGQTVLLARRLVEAGVPLVTVFWPNDGITNVSVYWDTHNRNFIDLKTRLMPPADQALSALLDDLAVRGLLDSTLVVWSGEFGRTPRVGQAVVGGAGAGRDGRDHWPHCYSSVLAGAGVRGGTVHGASDRWAAYPSRDPVTPADLAATAYHLLGVDPRIELTDPLGRPLTLCQGTPIQGVME